MSMSAKPKFVIVFKPVPGGFVFAAPKPWLIGRTNYYFVTAAQRDEVTAASQPLSYVAIFSTLMTSTILGLGAAMAFIWYRHSYQLKDLDPSSDTVITLAALVLSMMLVFRIAFRSRTNRLRPLLATLPKSDVRIIRADVRRATLDMFSAKQLWLQAALAVFSAGVGVGLWLILYGRDALSGDPVSIGVLIGACAIIGWSVVATLRLAVEKTMQEKTRS